MTDITALLRDLPRGVGQGAVQAAIDATAPSITQLEVSTPKVSAVTMWWWALRIGLLIGGGYTSKWAQDNDQLLLMIATMLATAGVTIWSGLITAWEKWRGHQIAVAVAAATAYATAVRGKPTEVLVQPPPPTAL